MPRNCTVCTHALDDNGECPIAELGAPPPLRDNLAHATNVLGVLKEIRKYANLETFSGSSHEPFALEGDSFKESQKLSDFVRETTRGYRGSWVTPLIDMLIEREQYVLHRNKRRTAK